MEFQPLNRYIWIKKKRAKKEGEKAVLLPDGYKDPIGPDFAVVEVLQSSWQGGSDEGAFIGDVLVVRNHMIESVNVGDKTFHMVLANHVVGKLVG